MNEQSYLLSDKSGKTFFVYRATEGGDAVALLIKIGQSGGKWMRGLLEE